MRSSARSAERPRAATSGPGATSCSSSRRGQTPDMSARAMRTSTASCGPPATRPSGEFHYLGFDEALAAVEAAERGRHRDRRCSTPPTRAAGSTASASSPSPSTCARSRRCAPRDLRSASPPTPSAPAPRTGSRRSAGTPTARGCRCTSMRTSSRARSRSAWPSTACRPIELLDRTGCLGLADDDRPRDARRRRRARPDRPRRRAHLRLPDDRGEPRRRLPPRRAGAARAASASASAPTRTSASIRSRSCASSRASRVASRAAATSSASMRSSRSAAAEGAAALGLERGTTSRSTSSIRRCAASTETTCLAALVFGCAADVLR